MTARQDNLVDLIFGGSSLIIIVVRRYWWPALMLLMSINILLSILSERRLSDRVDCIVRALDATDDGSNIADLCPNTIREAQP